MRLLTIVGTRPQIIKEAALQQALRSAHHEVLVDTGQHWSDELAGRFFRELGLSRPDHTLGVGGGSHASQTAAMLERLEPILLAERPEAVVVFGDTNSTLAGALAAAKLNIPVAHVEAGLRSFDRAMPEEINRVVADHLSRWLFAPTPAAVANLAAEGITAGVSLCGDLMQELAARTLDGIRDPSVLDRVGSEVGERWPSPRPGGYLFATVHRQANRDPVALRRWADVLGAVSRTDRPTILALHPGTKLALAEAGIALPPTVVVTDPLGYAFSLALQLHAAAVVTDSGGVQRESAWLGVPCLVLRTSTEWIEAVRDSRGDMVLVGLDGAAAARELDRVAPMDRAPGDAGERAGHVQIDNPRVAEAISSVLEASGGRSVPPAP